MTGPFVLKNFNQAKDRNQPGSRRFELKSCKNLIVEQTIFYESCPT
jgi:hypothetical protein